MKKREPGFYWVKWNGKDEVAEWTGENWCIAGVESVCDIELSDFSDDLLVRSNRNWKEETERFMEKECSDYVGAPYFSIENDEIVIDGHISIENFKKMCSIVRGN